MPSVATNRSSLLRVRLTASEEERLKAEADAAGLAVSALVRLRLFGERVPETRRTEAPDYDLRIKQLMARGHTSLVARKIIEQEK